MPNIFDYQDAVAFLRDLYEFERSRYKNRSYSIRSWSRKFELSAATISRILAGKRRLTPSLARKIALKMELTAPASMYFQILSTKEIFESDETVFSFKSILQSSSTAAPSLPVDISKFELVSEWYYGAIVELMGQNGFDGKKETLAARLLPTIDENTLDTALSNLITLGLIQKNDEKYEPLGIPANFVIDPRVSSPAVRIFHQQMLQLAKRSLLEDAFEERDFRGLSLSLDDEGRKQALGILDRAYSEVIALARREKTNRVYQLNTQIFPLSTKENQ